jgi:HSP20 family molecular chaperone IbpA
LEDVDNHYVYEIPVPGLTKDEVSIKLKNNRLEIRGGVEGHKWSPLFSRTISLPKNADVKTVKATVEHGVLCVKIDKDKEFETTIKVV